MLLVGYTLVLIMETSNTVSASAAWLALRNKALRRFCEITCHCLADADVQCSAVAPPPGST